MRKLVGPLILLGPLPLFLLLAYAVPFLGVVRWSVTLPEPGLSQYVRVVTDPVVLSVVARTLRVCVVVTALTLAIAYSLAFAATFSTRAVRAAVMYAVLIPFWISTLTRAFGWLALLFNRGIVNTALIDLGIISFPLALVRNETGVVIGMTHFLVPFAVLPLSAAMRQVDVRVLMAARGMGVGRLRTFWSVLVPMTLAGIVGAAVITFIFALGFFITPAILGGGRSIMVAEFVYVQTFQTVNWGLAGAIAVILAAAMAVLLAVLLRLVRVERLAR